MRLEKNKKINIEKPKIKLILILSFIFLVFFFIGYFR